MDAKKQAKKEAEKRAKKSAYLNEYIKAHYLRKEVKLNKQEAELLTAVLNDKKMTFKAYTIANLKRDAEKIKKSL